MARGEYGLSVGGNGVGADQRIHRQLVVEANQRFWDRTHYKRGQRLDPSDPEDRAKMPIWMRIYRDVLREHATGKLVLPPSESVPPITPQPRTPPLPPTQPAPQPQLPPTQPAPQPPQPPLTVDRLTEDEAPPSSDSARSSKGLLVVGGLLVAGVIGKIIYNEMVTNRLMRELEQSIERKRSIQRRAVPDLTGLT